MSFLGNIRDLIPSAGWLLGPREPTGPFTPTYSNVCRARALLKALKLPTELVLIILDEAEYWPTVEFSGTERPRPVIARAHGRRSSAATRCLEAQVFDNAVVNELLSCHETPKIKRIEFEVTSQDQGWTSQNTEGTFSTYSWLEVSILRDASNINSRLPTPRLFGGWISSPLDYHTIMVGRGWSLVKRPEDALQGPQDGEDNYAWFLQGNRVMAGRDDYRIVWSKDGNQGNAGSGSGKGFIEALGEGDRVLVWARAKYPGWQCIVDAVRITVYYGL